MLLDPEDVRKVAVALALGGIARSATRQETNEVERSQDGRLIRSVC